MEKNIIRRYEIGNSNVILYIHQKDNLILVYIDLYIPENSHKTYIQEFKANDLTELIETLIIMFRNMGEYLITVALKSFLHKKK